ncbi:MAG: DNA polymerase III subunit beta [Bacteroidetes bacterium]|nr:DNA polymerase III subunit beta [Bacteroidota bacterium]MBM3424890.1 DNA polymerase III subunit beta [Bacteroidota bacterium]
MNFVTSSSTLLHHLQSISGALSTNTKLPILDNFLFKVEGQKLTIVATDLETTMITHFEVQSEGSGSMAIPAKLLLEVLKNLPDQPCSFRINMESYAVEIAYDNGKSKMIGFNSNEFPKLPAANYSSSIEVSGELLSSAISKTLFAVGTDEMRPTMTGVLCEFSPENITFVATDAHKLVRYRRTDISTSSSSSFILPKKPLNLLKGNIRGEEQVRIEYNESNATFTFSDLTLVCRLIDGKYPNYEAVIPKENPNVLTVERGQFHNSLRRVAIFSNKTTHQVLLKLAGSELQLSAEDMDFSSEANERLTCNYLGSDMTIAFNARPLVEMLSILETESIQLSMSEPSRAGLITPFENKNANEHILMLVMPVMLPR